MTNVFEFRRSPAGKTNESEKPDPAAENRQRTIFDVLLPLDRAMYERMLEEAKSNVAQPEH